ncbi:MAG TPA: ATP-binding protein, partial [Puia sp.]|nr:ATP-binding protein [Puia sp.]
MYFIIKRLCTHLTFVFLAGIAFLPCSAQIPDPQYQLLTVNDGLPQNYLLGLAQDSVGFIWIGTKDGLARYDGYHFKTYRHGKDSLRSPAFNNVTNLYTDRRGFLWIQYDNRAVDRYDPSTGIFDHVSNEKTWDGFRSQILNSELIVDRHNNLWLLSLTGGFYRYSLQTHRLVQINVSSGLLADSARGIVEDHAGKIWLVTQKGFSVYDYSSDKIDNIRYQLSDRQSYSGRNYKFGVGELADGRIIVTSLDSPMLIYNPINRSCQATTLPRKKALVYDAGVGNTNVVNAPNGDRLFICNGKIFRIDNATGKIDELEDPTRPATPDASVLLLDRSGNLWFGKNAQGLCKMDLHASRFVSKQYSYPNFETEMLVNELGIPASKLPPGFANPAFAYMFRNAIDTKNGLIWIQNYLLNRTSPRLMAYDMESGQFLTKNILLSKYGEVGVTTDHSGGAWLIGVNSWTPHKVTWQQGRIDAQPPDIDSPSFDSLFYAGKIAVNPVVDKDTMWVMSSNMNIDFGEWSLVSIDLRSKKRHPYPLAPDNAGPASGLLMMVEDPSNRKYLWIGTAGNGLIRFDKATGNSHAFTTDDGLPNNTIYAIVPDDNGNLWLSSNKGISRFNPATRSVRNFDISDGLSSNEFNRWHCFKLPDGRIAFGGIAGYTIFRPADITDDGFQPRVLISNVTVNNNSLPDSAIIRNSSLDQLTKLILPYDQNFLGFEFSTDEFNAPKKTGYRYRLSGIDNDWVNTNERFANYTKLPPGDYLLEINASNSSGIWSNRIKTVRIIIIPPWWRTWWAYLIYVVAAIVLLASFFNYRLRQIRLKQEIILHRTQTEQLKALDEMKSRFFSNITHEFRTPLTLIISPVEKLQSETTDDRVRKTLSSVQNNAQHLLQLINQLLDLSKIESGNMQLNYSRGMLDEFMSVIVNSFLPLAEKKQIQLKYRFSIPQERLFDAEKLKTILLNLLSNAIKFTPSGGTIDISGEVNGGDVVTLVISDTGIGIPADKLPFIFHRFFQVDDSRTRLNEGTGIGLALVKELMNLMHGTVAVESLPNKGTTFTLILRVQPAGDIDAQDSPLILPLKPSSLDSPLILPIKPSSQDSPRILPLKPPSQDSPLILLVEDNDELLSFLRERFERNFRVLTASNGAAAFDIAREELPDVVISDIMMPQMDGYAFCSKLKSDTITAHIAVILLSARSSYESRLGGLQLGADDYISKPFHADELETRVHNLLERQERLRLRYRARLQSNEGSDHLNGAENLFLKNIYSIIEGMIDDPQLGASMLAEKNAMSLRTLNRKLQAMIGLTAGDLIRQYRLQKSLSLLKSGHNVS